MLYLEEAAEAMRSHSSGNKKAPNKTIANP